MTSRCAPVLTLEAPRRWALLTIVLSAACGDAGHSGPRLVASAAVGPEGGRLAGEAMALEIPAGALQGTETLSVYAEVAALPDREALTPLYRFEPNGLEFSAPATVRLEIPEGRTGLLFWTRADGTGFEALAMAAGGEVSAPVGHFSEAYVDPCAEVSVCRCAAPPQAIPEGDDDGPTDPITGDGCFHDPGHDTIRCEPDTLGDFIGQPGETQTGWFLRNVYRDQCFCTAASTWYEYQTLRTSQTLPYPSLCLADWTPVNGGWQCLTDLNGQPPVPNPTGIPQPTDDWGQRAFTPAFPGSRPCQGYFIDFNQQDGPDGGWVGHRGGQIDGLLDVGTLGCINMVVDFKWESHDCELWDCRPQSLEDVMARRPAEGVTPSACSQPEDNGPATVPNPDGPATVPGGP